MSQTWTVVPSRKGFHAPLTSYGRSILADIAKASGRKQDLAIARWDEFKSFVDESGKICTGMSDLPASLRPVTNLAGRIIPDLYVLTVGSLRGYYQVEYLSRNCLAKLFRADTDKAVEDLANLLLSPDD
jgi:hypothetical protein